MKHILNILLFFLVSIAALATNQSSDILIWNNDTLSLFSNPLELNPEWAKLENKIRQEIENEDRRINPDKYKNKETPVLSSTMCNQGFIAEWKIFDNKIYLNNIYACEDTHIKIQLQNVFRGKLDNELLFGQWITGDLRVPQGKCIEFVNLDYLSIYESEIELQFVNGFLKDTVIYHNSVIKNSQFSADPDPNHYLEFVYGNINWKSIPKMRNNQFQVIVGIQPNYEGKIDSIISENTYLITGSKIINDQNNRFIQEAIRIAKLIPNWDVVIQRKKIVTRSMIIIFDENHRIKYTR